MNARDFIAKWGAGGSAHALNERAGAQSHFIDLCRLLDVPEPADPQTYCFERGVTQTGSAAMRVNGFADVWLKGHFAWEYKAPGKNLEGALKQLMMYALPLESPPLLVVGDRLRIEIHTHFTGTPSERHVVALEDIGRPEVQEKLRWLWTAPERFKPARSNREITEQAARTFAGTADRLRDAGVPAEGVSHFLTQCLFCFFAEDTGLLPARLFERLVGVRAEPARLRTQLQSLFETMRDGGLFGVDDIPWFNGGLFKQVAVPPLAAADVDALKAASALDWSAIDPSIFGTLFERGLDPAKRSQLGAHYTDPATIWRLVEPVVQRPLLAEWNGLKPAIEKALVKSKKHGDKAYRDAQAVFAGFLERLRAYRVLDPACGSGNFLYLALKCLKDIEHQVNFEAEALGLERQHDLTGPHNVLGIELNEYAAELARVTVWIGELQWRIQQGYGFKLNPVLEPLDHIRCGDALMNADGSEAQWPKADAVVGNPPFVGVSRKRRELGGAYVEALDRIYGTRVRGGADFVCYWFEKARAQIEAGALQRAGLVSTNSIRGGASRAVLEAIVRTTRIFEARADEAWVNNGAAVRVSLLCFGSSDQPPVLDGVEVPQIYADLTAPREAGEALNVSRAAVLAVNAGASFQGASKKAKFEITADLARSWLSLPNPHGRPNSDVLKPWANGFELSRRPQEQWIIDFGNTLSEHEAALYEAPFSFVAEHVRPERITKSEPALKTYWWRFGRPRVELRVATAALPRFIATVAHSKHRFFVWLPVSTSPDQALITIARADDTSLGLVHSWFHELWSLRLGTSIGVGNDPRYTPTTCFETFPFPAGLTPADTAHQRTEPLPDGALIPADLPASVRPHAEAIARAAKRLTDLRDAWLNPPEWTERVPEVVPLGMAQSPYPDRIVAKAGFEKELAKRTLTNLYNQRPAWLAQAHAALDDAVAAAYGWTEEASTLSDDEILRRLLALNLERSRPQPAGEAPPQPGSKLKLRPLRDRVRTVPAGGDGVRSGNIVIPDSAKERDGTDAPYLMPIEDILSIVEMSAGPAEAPAALPDADLLRDPRNVPVWFATNRAPLPEAAREGDDPALAFGNDWSEQTTLGRLVVNVPKGHVPGSLGSGFWLRLVRGDDRLRAVSLHTLAADDFWAGLSHAMGAERAEGEPRDALLFLHGYNTSFRDAALRTAQLAYDLRIRPAVFFSWPSGASVDAYAADESVIELSNDAISAFVAELDACAAKAGAMLHVVGHSMGNRALLRALEALARTPGTPWAIDKIVFAAPDVDARLFTQSLAKIRALGRRKTLYVSQADRALWLSRALHKYHRAGLLPPVTVFDGVDTIDATDVDETFLGHTYIATVRALIADLKSLFEAGRAPAGRTGLEPMEDGALRWWRLK